MMGFGAGLLQSEPIYNAEQQGFLQELQKLKAMEDMKKLDMDMLLQENTFPMRQRASEAELMQKVNYQRPSTDQKITEAVPLSAEEYDALVKKGLDEVNKKYKNATVEEKRDRVRTWVEQNLQTNPQTGKGLTAPPARSPQGEPAGQIGPEQMMAPPASSDQELAASVKPMPDDQTLKQVGYAVTKGQQAKAEGRQIGFDDIVVQYYQDHPNEASDRDVKTQNTILESNLLMGKESMKSRMSLYGKAMESAQQGNRSLEDSLDRNLSTAAQIRNQNRESAKGNKKNAETDKKQAQKDFENYNKELAGMNAFRPEFKEEVKSRYEALLAAGQQDISNKFYAKWRNWLLQAGVGTPKMVNARSTYAPTTKGTGAGGQERKIMDGYIWEKQKTGKWKAIEKAR